jgi:hypothetical protein
VSSLNGFLTMTPVWGTCSGCAGPKVLFAQCGVLGEPYNNTRGRLVCSSCGRQATVTAGTIFDKTRTPLTSWFAAAWYVTSQQNGVSAMALKQALGLGSYQTAWTMLHKLRRVPDASASSLLPFVREALEPGAEVRTDGWGGYSRLAKHGYLHNKTVLSSSGDPAHVSMPAVHRVSSLLKGWLLGTHRGAVRPAQLDRYLDEFTFRFNRRSSRSRGLLFYRLLEQAALTSAAPYRFIVGGKP